LLKRVWGEDILVCPRCSHRPTRIIAAIDDPPLVERILGHLGLPTGRPSVAPARSPPLLDDGIGSDFAVADDFDAN
jgi:hypothetical protein